MIMNAMHSSYVLIIKFNKLKIHGNIDNTIL